MTTLDLRGASTTIRGTAGADMSVSITFTDSAGDPVDVSGYTAAADVLRGSTVVDSFATAVSGAGSNVLTLTLTDAETLAIGSERRLRWRLSMTAGGVTEQWISGGFELSPFGEPAASNTSSLSVQVSGAITATVQTPLPLATLDGRYLLSADPVPEANRLVCGVVLYRTTDQTISNATVTAISWDGERYDSDGFHESVTNPSRITIPAGLGGLYLVTANVQWATNTSGIRSVSIERTSAGTQAFSQVQYAASPTFTTCQSLSTCIPLEAGDYFTIEVYQNSGGSLALAGNSSGYAVGSRALPEVSVIRLGGLS